MRRKTLAILTTHPIQYQAPWFRALTLHPELSVEVFFCHQATPQEQANAGFGVAFDWDISLLEGYSHRVLHNVAKKPSVNKFAGLDTPEIKGIIASKQYDAVIVCGWHFKSAWQAIRACWRTKTPVMVRGDSHLKTSRHPLKKALKQPFYSWFVPRLDACLAVGQWSKEYYLHYGASVDRIFLVPHVVDDVYFAQESARLLPRRSELRRQWGLKEEATVFLFVAKFIDKKRPLDFVEAVARATKDCASVVGLMVGDGPLRVNCQEWARSQGVPVSFAGFLNQSRITEAYVAADALVLPSDGGETWGLVVNEAMTCGRPCFVSDQVGCGPDMIIPKRTGSIFPVGDIQNLAQLFAFYAADPDALGVMGQHARMKVQEYSMSAAVDGVVRAINMISVTKK